MNKKTARTLATQIGAIIDQFPGPGAYDYNADACLHCDSKGALRDALEDLCSAHANLLEFAAGRGRGKHVDNSATKSPTC